jgi:hypothetical protein
MTLRNPPPNKGKRIPLSGSAEIRPDYNRAKPTFSLIHVDPTYCITCCDVDERASFAETIRNLSQLTWNELRSTPHRGLGCEKINRDAIRRPIPQSVTEDVTFLAFRFHGKKAMVGYRVDETFHIVWFDRDFSLYDHG